MIYNLFVLRPIPLISNHGPPDFFPGGVFEKQTKKKKLLPAYFVIRVFFSSRDAHCAHVLRKPADAICYMLHVSPRLLKC